MAVIQFDMDLWFLIKLQNIGNALDILLCTLSEVFSYFNLLCGLLCWILVFMNVWGWNLEFASSHEERCLLGVHKTKLTKKKRVKILGLLPSLNLMCLSTKQCHASTLLLTRLDVDRCPFSKRKRNSIKTIGHFHSLFLHQTIIGN